MQFDLEDPEQAMIVELRTSNTQRITALQQQGHPIGVNRTEAVVEFLLDLLTADPAALPMRLAFEREHAQKLADQIDALEQQLLAQKFSAGVQVDPRALRAVARPAG